MTETSLQEKRDKYQQKMDYLCSSESIDEEVFFLIAPLVIVVLTCTLILTVAGAYILQLICKYDSLTALKISGCFCFMLGILAIMLIREWAYKKASEAIAARRKKIMTALDKVNYKIRKQHGLEFIPWNFD